MQEIGTKVGGLLVKLCCVWTQFIFLSQSHLNEIKKVLTGLSYMCELDSTIQASL